MVSPASQNFYLGTGKDGTKARWPTTQKLSTTTKRFEAGGRESNKKRERRKKHAHVAVEWK